MTSPIIAHPPETLEGWYSLHQIFRFANGKPDAGLLLRTVAGLSGQSAGRSTKRKSSPATASGSGWTCFVKLIGSTSDLMAIHFRDSLDAIGEAEQRVAKSPAAKSLVPNLSDRIDTAIRAAVHPNPDRRPPTCLDFFKLLTGRSRMKGGPVVTPAPIKSSLASAEDRRNSARFPLQIGTCGIIDSDVHRGGGAQDLWPLVMSDVSTTGIGVLLARRFEPGTALSIELALGKDNKPRRLPVHVVRVQQERAGHWVHGCSFDVPLTEEQLKVILKDA